MDFYLNKIFHHRNQPCSFTVAEAMVTALSNANKTLENNNTGLSCFIYHLPSFPCESFFKKCKRLLYSAFSRRVNTRYSTTAQLIEVVLQDVGGSNDKLNQIMTKTCLFTEKRPCFLFFRM